MLMTNKQRVRSWRCCCLCIGVPISWRDLLRSPFCASHTTTTMPVRGVYSQIFFNSQMCGKKIYRTNSTSMHPPKVSRRFSWNAALTQCKLSCWRKMTSPAWCTREDRFTSNESRALWSLTRRVVRDHSRWTSNSTNARHSMKATCSRILLWCNMIQNLWRRATLHSNSNATLESQEVWMLVLSSKRETQGKICLIVEGVECKLCQNKINIST